MIGSDNRPLESEDERRAFIIRVTGDYRPRRVKKHDGSGNLRGEDLIKEVNRRIRLARSYWDAHRNSACRTERERALKRYDTLTKEQKGKIPQVLRVWLRSQDAARQRQAAVSDELVEKRRHALPRAT